MRKIYILRENEEDGRLLAALEAAGLSTDESEFTNPTCPLCGSSTLLAYTKGEQFELLTWYEIDDDEGAGADAWYLVCSGFECTYEEEVERVFDPMGATAFDQEVAHHQFDEYSGMLERTPVGLKYLISYLQSALEEAPNRKLEAVLDEAEWRYEKDVKQARKWINQVPLGKRVRFRHTDEAADTADEIEGTFVSATDEGFLLLRAPDEQMMLVKADEIYSWEPRKPAVEEISERRKGLKVIDRSDKDGKPRMIYMCGSRDIIVVQGHHLHVNHIDRYGQYHVYSSDPTAAAALSLEAQGNAYWEGVFRRSDVEARYEVGHFVKVKGHWLEQHGVGGKNTWVAVHTEDPDIAAALGLEEQTPLFPPETEEERQRYRPRWTGLFPNEEVEERKEVRTYRWPLPELQVPEA
ncbi:MAG: hypothetical protein K0R39_561 [Symbiobacteriaceae bacterium]|jgi:hypothetical protein|nr:hypothetical protein [Symbiobacteriaceae bacterium]